MRDYLRDYREKREEAGGFFRQSWFAPGALEETAKLVKGRRVQPVVLAELRRLNAGRSPKLDENLAALERGEALVVVTGQQLGFLGGPLHTLYKAATCIRAARHCEAVTGIKTVPLFWLQSEDHDFAEIADASFFNAQEELSSISLEPETSGTGDSVGRIALATGTVARIEQFLKDFPGANVQMVELLLKAYGEGSSLVSAFAELTLGIYGHEGLLVFDPAVRPVKELCRDFVASCFLRAGALNRLLDLRAEELKAAGYGIQVPVKAGSPLFFISHKGRRERLVEDPAGNWQGSDYSLSKEELYNILAANPEVFTSSALIRPLLQDSLFPVVTYVSGPAEFRYHAQLKTIYPFLGCVQPLILPRAQFVVLEKPYQRLLEKLGLEPKNVEASGAEFVAGLFNESEFDSQKVFSQLEDKVISGVGSLGGLFGKIDPDLNKALSVTQESLRVNLNRLKQKYEKALARHEGTKLQQFERLRKVFFPGEEPQERRVCLSHFLLKSGAAFSAQVLAEAWPSDSFERKVLRIKE